MRSNSCAASGHSPNCRFCTLPERWRIVLEAPHFFVLMGLGPMVPGYSIIITREHSSCFAALPKQNLDEFVSVLGAVQESQRIVFGDSRFFEHGRNGGCLPHGHDEDLCYHAHMHVLPASVDLVAAVRVDYETETLDSWRQLTIQTQGGTIPYLLMQNGGSIELVLDPKRLPGRYLRTKAAEQLLGDGLYADWQAIPAYELVREGRVALESTLREVWRIQQSGRFQCNGGKISDRPA
jgi:diadenosine tetraphosphate (Ap4A) HIT family hydrolase